MRLEVKEGVCEGGEVNVCDMEDEDECESEEEGETV